MGVVTWNPILVDAKRVLPFWVLKKPNIASSQERRKGLLSIDFPLRICLVPLLFLQLPDSIMVEPIRTVDAQPSFHRLQVIFRKSCRNKPTILNIVWTPDESQEINVIWRYWLAHATKSGRLPIDFKIPSNSALSGADRGSSSMNISWPACLP